jgi:hypothetical protein
MPVCTACTKIAPDSRLLLLHPDVESLRTSAQSCPLCLMILGALEKYNLISEAENYRAHIEGVYELVNDTSITVSMNGHDTSSDEKAHALILSCGPIKRETGLDETKTYNASTAWLAVEAEESSTATEVIVTRPLAEDPRSEKTLKLIKKWIKACVDGHENCQIGYTREEIQFAGEADDEGARLKAKYTEGKSELPTRVIDVEAFEDGVRLVETKSVGGRGCYIALSHVWGKSQHLTTETATYKDRLTSILLSTLPKTFKDAVVITRRLGVRYLWIDSLCVIQDSVSDWMQESARMASVYMNAYVTISATSASDGDGGCFIPRQTPPSSVSLSYVSPSSDIPDGSWTIHNRTPGWDRNVRRSVLASRAWTLQEKYLARRTLHFATDQVSFECKTGLEFETQRPGQKITSATVPFQFLYWILVGFRGKQAALDLILPAMVMRTWARVVEDYTTRKLTFEKDKLAALDGLAQHVASLTLDQYCFGLWKANILSGIMWRTAPYEDVDERRGRIAGRAPSWSWASMDGRVYFAYFGEKPLDNHDTNLLEDVSVAVDGTLTVSGSMIRLEFGKLYSHGQWDVDQFLKVFTRIKATGVHIPFGKYEYVRSADHSWFGYAAMDECAKEEGYQEGEVDALLVRQQPKRDTDSEQLKGDPFKGSYLVLFLEGTSADRTFTRIGMGQLFLCEDIKDLEKSQIFII